MTTDTRVNLSGYERALSVVGGGALMRLGVRRGFSFGGVIAAAAGVGLVYRGVTGHCGVYERLGISTTREAAARGVVVRRAMTIQRSRDDVYRKLREFHTMPEILQRLTAVDDLGGGVYRWYYREGRRELEIVTELVTDEPGQRLAWVSRPESQIRCDGDVRLVPAPDGRGTEVHAEIALTPPGGRPAMILAPLFRRVARYQLGQEFHRLQQILETGEIATAAMRPERRLEERAPAEQIAAGAEVLQ